MKNNAQFKFNKINRTSILFCFLIIGCSSNEYNNQKMMASIDKLEISEIITEVETDSSGNILDTLSIEYLKYDYKKRKRFRKKVNWYEDRKMSWIDYLKPDEDLFYRESFDGDSKSYSVFETILNEEGKIEKAIQINRDIEPFDTIHMDYIREYYSNGKIKELLIKMSYGEIGELVAKTEYDEHEKRLLEVTTIEEDTTSFLIWEYSDTILQKKIYTNYQIDTSKLIYYYGEEKMLINEEQFDFENGKFIKSKEINHFYDESNDRTKSVKRNLETSEMKYVKYLYEK